MLAAVWLCGLLLRLRTVALHVTVGKQLRGLVGELQSTRLQRFAQIISKWLASAAIAVLHAVHQQLCLVVNVSPAA